MGESGSFHRRLGYTEAIGRGELTQTGDISSADSVNRSHSLVSHTAGYRDFGNPDNPA